MPTAKKEETKYPIEGEVIKIDTVADHVNRLHEEAQSSATNAVEKAIECGSALLEVKSSLKHGEFKAWIEDNCKFKYSSAKIYMKAAKQKGRGLPFSSLNQLYGPKTPVDAHERDAKDATRDTASLSKTETDVVQLNDGLEGMQLPLTTPELFVAEAGDSFLSDKAAKRLEWLVGLFDTITNKAQTPGR